MSSDTTLDSCLSLIAENALRPIWSLKELLLNLDDMGVTVAGVLVGDVLESLLKQAEAQIDAADDALDQHLGAVRFIQARANHPKAKTGEIVDVTMEPKDNA